MKKTMKLSFMMVFMISTFVFASCNSDDDNDTKPDNSKDSCYVQLYDGDNFTDDTFKLKGPGKFKSLKNLPGADKDWDDEADALKVGSSATVTIYSEENFEGESKELKGGAEEPDLAFEPRSIKISCK